MDRKQAKKDKERLDRIIGQNIRSVREEALISRDGLAETLDLTVSHMGLIERGERGATLVTLEKISNIFDVSIDSLFAEPDKKRLVVKETRESSTAAGRQKLSNLLTRLNNREIDFAINMVRGIILLKHDPYDPDEDNE